MTNETFDFIVKPYHIRTQSNNALKWIWYDKNY